MSRDNSPKIRRERKLERKLGQRKSYDRILIVTEGSETEPNYFKEIRSCFRLNTTNIEIMHGQFGTEPIQLVEYAEKLFLYGDSQKQIKPKTFESVYIVFDRDEHINYHNALFKADSLNQKYKNDLKQPVKFRPIVSRPCFELWFLLHYEEINHPIHRDEVKERLKKHIPDYSKNKKGLFSITWNLFHVAKSHAKKLRNEYSAFSTNLQEPFTDVDSLVSELISLKK